MKTLTPGRWAADIAVADDARFTEWVVAHRDAVHVRGMLMPADTGRTAYELECPTAVDAPAFSFRALTEGRKLDDLTPTSSPDYDPDAGGSTLAGALESVAKAVLVVGVGWGVVEVVRSLSSRQRGRARLAKAGPYGGESLDTSEKP